MTPIAGEPLDLSAMAAQAQTVVDMQAKGGKVIRTYKEVFIPVMMWESLGMKPGDKCDSYNDAVAFAKRHNPPPDAFKVDKLYEAVD